MKARSHEDLDRGRPRPLQLGNGDAAAAGAGAPVGDEVATYGIGTVSRLTGISTHTLRIWERRYKAVVAQRTPGGQRRYTSSHVERLTRLKCMVDKGEAISRLAPLSSEELSARIGDHYGHLASRNAWGAKTPLRVAVFGDYLSSQAPELIGSKAGINIVTQHSQIERFKTDISQQRPDVLVLELPIIGKETPALLAQLRKLSGARTVAVVYHFGRDLEVQQLEDSDTRIMRAPANGEEILNALSTATPGKARRDPVRKSGRAPAGASLPAVDAPPPWRFTRQQLAAFAKASEAIKCECTRHLVELIEGLSAFEMYSADCETRGDEESNLHGYLHRVSAQCRSRVEEALEHAARTKSLI